MQFRLPILFCALLVLIVLFGNGTRDVRAQTAPLAFANIIVSDIRDTQVTLRWVSTQDALSVLEYGPTTDYGFWIREGGNYKTNHETVLGHLTPKTTYHYHVVLQDQLGNRVISYDQTFKTLDEDSHDAPVITNVGVANVTSTTATITWYTDKQSDSTVTFDLFGATELKRRAGAGGLVTAHEVTIRGLQPGFAYRYQVHTRDKFGNVANGVPLTFTTAASRTSETLPLEITSITPTSNNDPDIGVSSVVITWTTNKFTHGSVESSAGGKNAPAPGGFRHSVTLDNLKAATQYTFKVRASDLFGQSVTSNQRTFITRTVSGQIPTIPLPTAVVPNTLLPGASGQPAATTLAPVVFDPALLTLSPTGVKFNSSRVGRNIRISPITKFVQVRGEKGVWAIMNGQRLPIQSPDVLKLYQSKTNDKKIYQITTTELKSYSLAYLVRVSDNPLVWRLHHAERVRHPLLTEAVLHSYPDINWQRDLLLVFPEHLALYDEMRTIKLAGDPRVYLLVSGKRLPILTESTFNRLNLRWDKILTVTQTDLERYPLGDTII